MSEHKERNGDALMYTNTTAVGGRAHISHINFIFWAAPSGKQISSRPVFQNKTDNIWELLREAAYKIK